jgi:CHAT domain-containing protein
LFATHARALSDRGGEVALELGTGADARYTAADTLHLQFNAELVVLSACESGEGADFAKAAHLAGVGLTLLTQWPLDDAAAAQFVGALFEEIAQGATVADALHRTQRAFARGLHGGPYRDPFFWAGWQLWGGL